MAGIYVHASSGPVALPAASTSKVIYQLNTVANDRLRIGGWGAAIQGTASGDSPVLVKMTRQSGAGTTPTNTGATLTKKDVNAQETIQTSHANGWATPPSAGTVIEQFYIHPQASAYFFFPQGQEVYVGTNAAAYLGFEVTTGATLTGTPNITIECDFEE